MLCWRILNIVEELPIDCVLSFIVVKVTCYTHLLEYQSTQSNFHVPGVVQGHNNVPKSGCVIIHDSASTLAS